MMADVNAQHANRVGYGAERPPGLRRRFLAILLFLLSTVAAPQSAPAQDKDIEHDGRLEGYQGAEVKIANDSTALIWILFIFLGGLSLGVLFKDAKRTHLD